MCNKMRVLGLDVMVLWRCMLLRRRIVIVAECAETVTQAVCASLALVSSPSIDFARSLASCNVLQCAAVY